MKIHFINRNDDGGGEGGATPPAADPVIPPVVDPVPEGGGDPVIPPVSEPEPNPITDEMLYAEIGKRYPTIKGKEDLDRFSSFNADEHIKITPETKHADFIKKATNWTGDIETLVRINKMDVDAMDNKESIIQHLMVQENMSRKTAEILFDDKYSAAFKDKDNDDDYNEGKAELANHYLQRDAVAAKKALNDWKATETTKGTSQPKLVSVEEQLAIHDKSWVQPIKKASAELQKITMPMDYELPDKTKVTEEFNFGLTDPESKKVAEDILTSKDSVEFMGKIIKRYGLSADGKSADFAKLLEPFLFYENRHSILSEVAKVSASKGVASHIAKVRPGSLAADKVDIAKPKTVSDKNNIIAAANKSYEERTSNL